MLTAAPPPPPVSLPVPDVCLFETPCVYVTPDTSEASERDELRTYYGRGWPAGMSVGISYGSPCYPPADVCTDELRIQRDVLTVGPDGTFAFIARNGPAPQPGPTPSVATRGVDGFGGTAPDGRRLGATPRRVPGPSTPAQRAEGAAIVRVTRQALRDIDRHARRRTVPAFTAYERGLRRCRDILAIERPKARAKMIDRMVDAAADAASYGVAAPELHAFTRRLRALHVTDPQLRAGIQSWSAVLAKPRFAPRPSLCAALRRWRDRGFSLAHPPFPRGRRTLGEDLARDTAIGVATERLVDLGLPRTPWVEQFGGRILGLENYIAF